MCEAASFIVCKGNRVFFGRSSDSHTVIREEHGLPDNDDRMIRNVQVEITPEGRDYNLPFEKWKFHLDQDLLPEWWDAESAEKACRAKLPEWAKLRLVRSGETRDVADGDYVIVCGGTVNEVCGGTVNKVFGGTVNKVFGGTVNEVCGGTVNKVFGGTVNEVCGGTVNEVLGGTVNEVWSGTVNEVWSGTVNEVLGGTVNEVRGGTVCFHVPFTVKVWGSKSVIIDRSGDRAICHVGTETMRTISSLQNPEREAE